MECLASEELAIGAQIGGVNEHNLKLLDRRRKDLEIKATTDGIVIADTLSSENGQWLERGRRQANKLLKLDEIVP